MIQDATVIRRMAKEAYALKLPEINEKLSAMKKWPSSRHAIGIISIAEAMKRIVKVELAELIYIGFVLMVETEDKTLYPVRTFDFMTGLSSDGHVAIAKSDLDLLRALKGPEALLDEIRDGN